MTEIQKLLFNHQDAQYGNFVAKLVPTEPRSAFIGVRSPEYKKILKELQNIPEGELQSFLTTLPHQFQEENMLHIALINQIKDFDQCIAAIDNFAPYVTNWAVSDGLNPRVFAKNHPALLPHVQRWIANERPYTKRIGMLELMKHFLGQDYQTGLLDQPAQIRSEEYYVNMMTAWLFAEALAKQWDSTIKYIEEKKLDTWTHNKAIQKAIESFRITPDQKEYLRSLKIKK